MIDKNTLLIKKNTKIFLPGDIVTIHPSTNVYSADEFLLAARTMNEDCFSISEKINLETFPSTRDYTGRIFVIEKPTNALILDVIGKPNRIVRGPRTNEYMVYSVFIEGKKYQCFGGLFSKS